MVFGLERSNLRWTLAVGAVVLLFSVGLPAFNSVLSTPNAVPAGTVVDVGLGVRITPAAGWSTVPVTRSDSREFRLGALALLISVSRFSGSTQAAYDDVHARLEKIEGFHWTADQATTTTSSGLVGIGNYFSGPSKTTGYVALFTADGVLAWVMATGPVDAWDAAVGDLSSMFDSVEIGPAQV